jgi:hypothetical protein
MEQVDGVGLPHLRQRCQRATWLLLCRSTAITAALCRCALRAAAAAVSVWKTASLLLLLLLLRCKVLLSHSLVALAGKAPTGNLYSKGVAAASTAQLEAC